MIKLIMDSSTSYLYILLIKNNQIIWKYLEQGNNDHSEKLSQLIRNMLAEVGIEVSEINQIIVGKGPGSYTGVRVGMTIAKMFAWAKQIPLYTFGSLDMMASSQMKQEGVYVISLDARRGNSFVKVLKFHNHRVETLLEDTFMTNTSIQEMIESTYPKAIRVDQVNENSFDYVAMDELGLIQYVEDIYTFVPNYVRSGI